LLVDGQNWYGLPAPVHLAKGMLLRAQGKWSEAQKAFEAALALDRQHGLPWDEARVLYEWGVMLEGTGDGPAARAKLGQALALFQKVGAQTDQIGFQFL
jgi:tetratricopeptide (TPR) repeat protein